MTFVQSIADGIFGLGFESEADGNVVPPLYNLVNEGLLSRPVFSLYLNRNANSAVGGELMFGGSDPAYYTGSFKYIPISRPNNWQISMDGVSAGTLQLCMGGCEARVSSSSSVISKCYTSHECNGNIKSQGKLIVAHFTLNSWPTCRNNTILWFYWCFTSRCCWLWFGSKFAGANHHFGRYHVPIEPQWLFWDCTWLVWTDLLCRYPAPQHWRQDVDIGRCIHWTLLHRIWFW